MSPGRNGLGNGYRDGLSLGGVLAVDHVKRAVVGDDLFPCDSRKKEGVRAKRPQLFYVDLKHSERKFGDRNVERLRSSRRERKVLPADRLLTMVLAQLARDVNLTIRDTAQGEATDTVCKGSGCPRAVERKAEIVAAECPEEVHRE